MYKCYVDSYGFDLKWLKYFVQGYIVHVVQIDSSDKWMEIKKKDSSEFKDIVLINRSCSPEKIYDIRKIWRISRIFENI